jgi:hypothetical protein
MVEADDMDDRELQRSIVNDRLARSGHTTLSDDELTLISALLKDSLLSELENLKSEDFSSTKTERANPGEETLTGHESRECVICGSRIKDFGHYAIEFGSQIRKRANLCGLDCMNEFMGALRESKGL